MGIHSDKSKRHKLTKKNRILWIKATGEIICEIEDGGTSTTECWRDDIEVFESDDKQKIKDKIKEKALKGQPI